MNQKPFVLPLETPMGKYFYEVNRNEIVAVNDDLFECIKKALSSEDGNLLDVPENVMAQYKELRECGYLSSNHVQEVIHPATESLPELLDRGLEKITLQVTQGCNLRCKYCIYSENSNHEQRSHSSNTMSLETAKKAILFYREHSRDKDRAIIGFYGGEPLLAFHMIVESVKYAEEVFGGVDISFNITTNATLLTDEIIDFLLDHHFKLTFSLDGPKEVQDKNRIFANGSGSYDMVMRNINRIYEKDPEALKGALVSMVIDQEQGYRDILPLFDEPALKNLDLVFTMVEEDSTIKMPSPQYSEEFNYEMFVAFVDRIRGSAEVSEDKYNKLMVETIKAVDKELDSFARIVLTPSTAPSGPCIPGKLKLFIDCFGNFYPCEKVDENEGAVIGTVDTGFDIEKVSKVLNVGSIGADDCKSCWAFSLCNICVKRSSENKSLSLERRRKSCQETRSSAYGSIMDKIVLFEDKRHMRKMNRLSRGE